MIIRFECFDMTILKATAVDFSDIASLAGDGCLRIDLPNNGTIILFMPYEVALEYASAINACNDREARVAVDMADDTFLADTLRVERKHPAKWEER